MRMRDLPFTLRRFGTVALTTMIGGLSGPALAQSDADGAAWGRARSADTLAGYEAYLERFPSGAYAEDAFRCVVTLSMDLPCSAADTGPLAGIAPAAGAGRGDVDVY